ncbi:arylsulfatase [Haloferula helveola]|uniref:Arylsulfatase n=1 Tax=Haloferula helveola TaxID=490095 RepID=A0ABN6H6F7_9BACT|nr:arylsulfatase [Haloferula helveola]
MKLRLLLALLVLPCLRAADAPPNLIFILADDMGWGDPACYGGKIATPHIDRIATEGMRFTDAHTTSAVCTPTRYSIVTGRYNWRSRMKKGVLNGTSPALIDADTPTIAGILGEAGYTSSVIGKWHLGLGWHKLDKPRKADSGPTKGGGWDLDYSKKVDNGPLARGFTHNFLFPASLDMPPYLYLRDDVPVGTPTLTKAFLVPNRPGAALADFEASACLADFARESRAFIGKCAEAKKPFFLYLPLTSPHTPIVPSEKWKGKSGLSDYADFMMETDWVVGEVLAELDARGVADNTLIVFTSDNGCSPMADIPGLVKKGHDPCGPWRGHKADIYEGGHRVPYVVRWPGQVKAGTTCDQTVSTVDWFATAADAAGLGGKIPDNAGVDSFSLVPLLRDASLSEPVRPSAIHHSINGSFAIRRGDWKLCLCPGSGGWSAPKPGAALKDKSLYPVQLFNLKDDPAEETNLAEKKPELVKELAAELATAIRKGRTTPGPDQANDGWPGTTPKSVVELLPVLKE